MSYYTVEGEIRITTGLLFEGVGNTKFEINKSVLPCFGGPTLEELVNLVPKRYLLVLPMKTNLSRRKEEIILKMFFPV